MSGGGGGGGGGGGDVIAYQEQKRKEDEARRKSAIAAIERILGIPGADIGPRPELSQFLIQQPSVDPYGGGYAYGGEAWYGPGYGAGFETVTWQPSYVPQYVQPQPQYDMAAYQAALDEYNRKMKEYDEAQRKREERYKKVEEDVLAYHTSKIEEEMKKAARALKQQLLASGNYGGSGQIYDEAELRRAYNEAVLDAERKARQAREGLEDEDMRLYADLVSRINAGMTGDEAAEIATRHMANSASRAIDEARGANLAGAIKEILANLQQREYMRGFSMRPNPFYPYQYQTAAVTPGSSSAGGVSGRKSM